MSRPKLAEVITPLLPHQQRVVDRMRDPDQPGLVVVHGLGSGKTLTSIATQDALGLPASVVLPASLQANYVKERAKHLAGEAQPIDMTTLQAVARRGEAPSSPMLILDEAHRIRDASTTGSKAMRRAKADKRLALTATPFYNAPSDVAPLVNFAAGSRVLPNDPFEFYDRYVQEVPVNPTWWGRTFRGETPGLTEKVNPKTAPALRSTFARYMDYHPGSQEGFPSVERKDVKVEMSPAQLKMYDAMLGEAPPWVAAKIRAGLPPSKREAQELNAFMGAVRQVSNTTRAYAPNADVHQPKIEQAFQNLQQYLGENERAKAVIYSNYLESGLHPYAQKLQEAGIPHGMFTGEMKQHERDQMVRDYNEGKLKALLLSSAGGEGLDLKGTRLMQVLDPHWNEEKLRQVEGRGVRYGSHADLPEEERKVLIERYLATRPKSGIIEKLNLKKPGGSVDEYLTNLSGEKERLHEQFRQLIPGYTKTSGVLSRGSGTAGGEETHHVEFTPIAHVEVKGKDYTYLLGHSADINQMVHAFMRDGKTLAYTTVTPQDGKLRVRSLYTDPDHRGKGLSKELWSAVRAVHPTATFIAKPDPFKDRSLSNEQLHKVYESYGFKKQQDGYLQLDPWKKEETKTAEFAEDGEHKLQGHLKFQGLRIAVENRKGSVRSGTTTDGHKWRTVMKAPYGYLEVPAKGKDGESIDVYVGPDKKAPNAFVVHQHKPDGTGHDEDKILLGTKSIAEARKLYMDHYDSTKFLGPVSTIPVSVLKKMVSKPGVINKLTLKQASFDQSFSNRFGGYAKVSSYLRDAGSLSERGERRDPVEFEFSRGFGADSSSPKNVDNSSIGNTKTASDVSYCHPFASHLDGLIDVPKTGSAMCSSVPGLNGQFKVADVIVQPVAVSMMNHLINPQIPSEKLSHYNPVFEPLLSSGVNKSVFSLSSESSHMSASFLHNTQHNSSLLVKQAQEMNFGPISEVSVEDLKKKLDSKDRIEKISGAYALLKTALDRINTPEKARGVLEPGDILITRSKGGGLGGHLFAKALEAAQSSKFYHSAMYVGDGRVVHSRLGEGITSVPLEKFHDMYQYRALRVDGPKEEREEAASFVKSMLDKGKPYDAPGLLKTFWKGEPGTGDERRQTRELDKYICSSLIAAAYPDRVFLGRGLQNTRPVDLAKSQHTKIIGQTLPIGTPVHKIAEEKSVSVGYASATVQPRGEDGVTVEKLWVDPEHRGKGEARKLLEHVKDQFSDKDIWLKPRPFGDMEAPLEALKDFYKNMGFEVTDKHDNMKLPRRKEESQG